MNLKKLVMAMSVGIGAVATLLCLLGASHTIIAAEPIRFVPSAYVGSPETRILDVTPIHYVAVTGTDSGNCSTPAGACRTVQYAVDQAGEADEVRVAAGTYTDVHARPRQDVSSTGLVTQVVYVTKTLTVKGGYSPTDWLVPDPAANPTTLDAGDQGRVLYAVGAGNTIVIEGLRLTGGDASGLAGDQVGRDAGGGAYVYSATAVISGVQVFENAAPYYGGGLYSSYNTVTLTGSAVYSNSADYGGGLFLRYSRAALSANEVYSNTAGWGGGIYCQYCDHALFSDNTIAANSVDQFGGGLTLYESQAALKGNTIAANVGIGLYMYQSEATLFGETLTKNTDYGMELRWGSVATLVNTLVVDNPDNGLLVRGASLHLTHATVARNGANGLYLVKDGVFGAIAALTNTILVSHNVGIEVTAGNTATLAATLWGTESWANTTDWSGPGTVVTGPINIWDNPGFVDAGAGDYHIGPGSAAVDAGVPAGVTTDIDGHPRPLGDGYDIGADEDYPPFDRFLPLMMVTRDQPDALFLYGGTHTRCKIPAGEYQIKAISGSDSPLALF